MTTGARTKQIQFAQDDDELASKKEDSKGLEDSGNKGESKMEVDAEDDDDDDWSEVSSRDTSAATRPSAAVAASPTQPRDVAPIDHMEVGNPWDSANAIASSPTHETSFDVAFNSPPPPAPKSKVIEQPDIPHFGNTDSTSESEAAKGNSGWADFSAFQSGHSQDQQKTLSENDTNAKAHESNSPPVAVAASAMSISVDSDQPQT